MILGISVLFLLIVLSGFFSGMEAAFISLGDIELIEIEKFRSKNGKTLIKLLHNKERLLSTILIGNNIVNIAASALNAALAVYYAPILGISEGVSISLSAGMLTVVILLFGEVAPKSLAIRHNVKLSLLFSPVILRLGYVLAPIGIIFDRFSKFLSRIFANKNREKQKISESTVINVVSKGEELGVINAREKTLIQNVFHFDEREVYPIMTPRTSVFALQDSLRLSDVKEELLQKQYSRVPIYRETIDNITGIVVLKSVFNHILDSGQDPLLAELAQKPIYVYETLTIPALLEQFRSNRTHMAIVVDEFGGMAGLVTLEDVLEELVGEIYDEKDEIDTSIRQIDTGRWLINGKTDIVTINKNITGEISLEGEFETLQGLIMSYLERIPQEGDFLFVNPHRYRVISMEKNEITAVLVEYCPQDENGENEEVGFCDSNGE